jgi:hypothetical protein
MYQLGPRQDAITVHCLGVTIVGSPFPAPPRKAESFTHDSSFLSLPSQHSLPKHDEGTNQVNVLI